MSQHLPARAAGWPLILAPLGRGLRRRLAKTRRAALNEEGIKAPYRDAVLADSKEEET
jgi:hypothetical protein